MKPLPSAAYIPGGKGPGLSRRQLLVFALPAMPLGMLTLPMSAYLPPLYAAMGVPLATIGLLFMVVRILDVVTDPLMGTLSDRTTGPFGRRRPWVLGASIPLALCVWLLFSPPSGAGFGWLAIMLFTTMLCTTMMGISHSGWSADVATDYHDRSRVQAAILMASIIGSLGVMAVPALLEGTAADPVALRAGIVGGIVAALAFPVALAAWIAVPDPPALRPSDQPSTGPYRAVLAALTRQTFLRRLLFADFMQGVAGGVLAGTITFYAAAKLLPERAALLLLAFYVAGMVFVPAWIWLSYHIGKARTIAFSSLLSILLLGFLALAPAGNLLAVTAAFAGFGTTMGVWIFLMKSLLSDLIAIEEQATGEPRAGLLFSLFLLTQKLGSAIAIGASYGYLDFIQFDPTSGPDEATALVIIGLTTGVPALGHAIMAWVTLNAPRTST